MKKILFFAFGVWISIVSFGQGQAVKDSLQAIVGDSIGNSLQQISSSLEDATKAEGDSAYMKNDYASAIQIYEALLNRGEAADIYYNLGNSYYKAGDIAKAILNYERALLLQPGNGDIRANLEIARSKTTKSLINSMSVDSWAVCGVVCFILLIVSLYLFIFSKQIVLKKAGFISGIVFLAVTILANVFANQQKDELTNRNSAIVINPSVTVRSTPSESGTSLFILHEGHKVGVKDGSMKDWKEIRLEDGKVGWVPASAIEII